MTKVLVALALVSIGAGGIAARQQGPIPTVPGARADIAQDGSATIAAGRTLYLTNCARCHGPDGLGAGPTADRLRRSAPDLTTFAERNGGVFPARRLEQIIDGRGIASHGTSEMPLWGNEFKRQPGVDDSNAVAERIRAITAFLESIQRRRG